MGLFSQASRLRQSQAPPFFGPQRARFHAQKAAALADRFANHAPKVRAELVGAALLGIVARGALVEDLLALGWVSLGEEHLDRLLGGRAVFAILDHALDRETAFFRPLRVEHLTGDDRRSERDDACEKHPAGDGVKTVVHEFP